MTARDAQALAGGPREEPAGLGHTSRAGVLFCLGFIESKWKCLHRLVTSLISKHGLIGGWSRGWGCQLYPQPWQGGVGEGRALLLIAHPSLSCSRGFCTAQPSWLAQLCAATSKIPKSSRAVPQSRCIFAHVGAALMAAQPPTISIPGKTSLITQGLLLHIRAGSDWSHQCWAGLGAAWKSGRCPHGMG